MAGLIIKGMDMPKSCYDCPLCDEECFGAYKCIKAESWGSETSRADDCPHRTVDGLVDKIIERQREYDGKNCTEVIIGLAEAIQIIKDYCGCNVDAKK